MAAVCFVLFSDDAQPDMDRWREHDTHRWSHNAIVKSIAPVKDDADGKSRIIDIVFERTEEDGSSVSGSVLVSPMPVPAQPSDDGNLPGRTLWPEKHFDQVLEHKTHWIVASAATDFEAHEQALLVTQVADAILRSHSSAVGVVWGADTLRIYGPAFQEIARLHGDDHLPVTLWVGIAIQPSQENEGAFCGMTSGMEAFDLMEIECAVSHEDADALRDRFLFLCEYLIEYGLVIADGDTFGFNETEKLKVNYGPSRRTPDLQVMHLSYPDSDTTSSSTGCIKSAVVTITLMAVVLGLIVGLVVGIGKLRSMLFAGPSNPATVDSASVVPFAAPTDAAPTDAAPTDAVPTDAAPTDASTAESFLESTAVAPQAVEPITQPGPITQTGPMMRPGPMMQPGPRSTPFQPPNLAPRNPFPAGPRFSSMPPRPSSSSFPPRRAQQNPPIPDASTAHIPVAESTNEARPPVVVAEGETLDSPAIALAYSHDGKYLAVSTRGHLRILNAETVRELAFGKTDAPFGRLVSVAFDRQSRFVVAGNGRGQFRWWKLVIQDDQSIAMKRLPSVLESQTTAIAAMTLNDAGTLLVTADQSGQLMWQRVSEDASKIQSAIVDTGLKGIHGLHFDQTNMSVQLCGTGGRVTVDLKSKSIESSAAWRAGSAAISEDGQWMVAAMGPRLPLFKAAQSDPVRRYRVARGMPTQVAFMADRYVVAADTSNVTIWSLASGEAIASGEIPSVPRPIIATSPDGQQIAIASTVTPGGVRILRP